MKKTGLIILVVLAVVVFAAAVVPAYAAVKWPAKLTVVNKADSVINLQLTGKDFYYLTIEPESKKVFTVSRDVYERITWTCGTSGSGTLDMTKNVKLVFMPCTQMAPNQGEPRMEKVSLFDSPTGIYWHYQEDKAR